MKEKIKMHPEKWYEWIIQTEECVAAHPEPGSCVGKGGIFIVGGILLFALLAALLTWYFIKRKN